MSIDRQVMLDQSGKGNRMTTETACKLCGAEETKLVLSEVTNSKTYSSYYCKRCNLHQTLGRIDPVSPDYIDLVQEDLDDAHRFLQTAHKLPAFNQWSQLIQKITDHARRNTTVLDIGCGIGGFLDYCKDMGLNTFGFDASPAHAKEARLRHPNVRASISTKAYIAELGMPEQRFDLITLWDVFEHIRNPKEFLQEIRGVAKESNSLLYISVPSGALNLLKVRIAKARNKPIGLIPWEHVFYYTPESLRKILNESGFEIIEISGVAPYVRSPLNLHESIRRIVHNVLMKTEFALQIYVVAKVKS